MLITRIIKNKTINVHGLEIKGTNNDTYRKAPKRNNIGTHTINCLRRVADAADCAAAAGGQPASAAADTVDDYTECR